jgi:hypothetical protein
MFRRNRWALACALAGAFTIFAGSAAFAAGGWTTVSIPATGNNTSLEGVFARTATDAWAVGEQFGAAGQTPPPAIYHWNGAAWSLVSSPALPGPGALMAVSASSATDAWAVGFAVLGWHHHSTVLEHWNGSAWTVDAADALNSPTAELNAVLDLSPVNAYAVGLGSAPKLEHWNGTAWSAVTLPDASFEPAAGQSISATSASDIWVVGTTFDLATDRTLAEALHFNGIAWTVMPMAQPGSNTPTIGAVTAISPVNAWAVGEQIGATSAVGGSTLIEHWDGASWSIVPSPTPGGDPGLTGVAARSATDVYALGGELPSVNGGPDQALILRWNGTSWTSDLSGTIGGTLAAAATFPGAATEWAVGTGSGNQGLVLSHS